MQFSVMSIPEALDSIPKAQRKNWEEENHHKEPLYTLSFGDPLPDVTMLIRDWFPVWMGEKEKRGRLGGKEREKAIPDDSQQ